MADRRGPTDPADSTARRVRPTRPAFCRSSPSVPRRPNASRAIARRPSAAAGRVDRRPDACRSARLAAGPVRVARSRAPWALRRRLSAPMDRSAPSRALRAASLAIAAATSAPRVVARRPESPAPRRAMPAPATRSAAASPASGSDARFSKHAASSERSARKTWTAARRTARSSGRAGVDARSLPRARRPMASLAASRRVNHVSAELTAALACVDLRPTGSIDACPAAAA